MTAMPMESPLEVLSRAASMVETTDAQREAALKRRMDQSPESELPAKMFRHLPSSPRTNDRGTDDESEPSNRRCAGTQTSYSSFPHDFYQNPRVPDYKILDLDRINRKSPQTPPNMTSQLTVNAVMPVSTNTTSYASLVTSRRTSRSPPTLGSNHANLDDCNQTPLNLTTSSSSPSSTSPPPPSYQQRPSVITIAPSYCSPKSSSETSPKSQDGYDASYRVTPGDADVSSIDEHFRRSLGQKYPAVYGAAPASPPTAASVSPARTWTPPSSASPPPPPAYQPPRKAPTPPIVAEKPKEVTIDGRVDDHFAKSLGDKWREINQPVKLDVAGSVDSRSVDDHFAKALGETWLRIKATKEGSRSNSSSPNSNHN